MRFICIQGKIKSNYYKDTVGPLLTTVASGSPIIQSGKLVGAVTHVFVNDSTKGYGIFAENMLETAQGVAESNSLKEVS